MKVAIFSAKSYDEESLQAANAARGLELVFFDVRLTRKTCGPHLKSQNTSSGFTEKPQTIQASLFAASIRTSPRWPSEFTRR